jgi:hypothetical protein
MLAATDADVLLVDGVRSVEWIRKVRGVVRVTRPTIWRAPRCGHRRNRFHRRTAVREPPWRSVPLVLLLTLGPNHVRAHEYEIAGRSPITAIGRASRRVNLHRILAVLQAVAGCSVVALGDRSDGRDRVEDEKTSSRSPSDAALADLHRLRRRSVRGIASRTHCQYTASLPDAAKSSIG